MSFIGLTDLQSQLIEKHLALVAEKNKIVNLTRIDDIEKARILHVEDSLSALPELNDCPEGLYGDLGSGAGFPGIPLAIASGRKTMLIDARKKKMDVVGEMLVELGLQDQVKTYAGRAELLARTSPRSFTALSARALSKLSVLMELATPLLLNGGRLICFKSQIEDDEMNHSIQLQKQLGMSLVSDREFMLGGEFKRRLVVFEKTGNPKIKLPRLEGQAQKNPL